MASYTTQLKNREEVAQGTMAFHFEKPAGFEFKPGQSIDLTLLNPPHMDAEGAIRTFSITSAPYEEDLVVAARMRDTSFKRALAAIGKPRVKTIQWGHRVLIIRWRVRCG